MINKYRDRKKDTGGVSRQRDSKLGLPICIETKTAQEASSAL